MKQPYLDDLMRFARDAAPALTFRLHEPGSPDAMVHLSRRDTTSVCPVKNRRR